MRLASDAAVQRMLRRVPRSFAYSAMEILLLCLLAAQCARLLWVMVTPVDPVGEWRQSVPRGGPAGSPELLGGFDPFFRLQGDSSPIAIATVDLELFGVREDRATGRGSAIISTPDGQQQSFAVGDEIMPGVVLTGVGPDNVTISRNGTAERIYLDQSAPVPPATQQQQQAGGLVSPPQPAPAAAGPELQYQPRLSEGRVTGFVVQPQGEGADRGALGLAPGDVIVAINGRPATAAQQVNAISAQLRSGDVTVEVEREGRTFPVRLVRRR